MDFNFPYKGYKASDLIKRCGYAQFFDPNTNEVSFVHRLGNGFYPRFHVYLKDFEKFFTVSLHLDQKHASYEGSNMHSGEYDGPAVENEARRITAEIARIFGLQM